MKRFNCSRWSPDEGKNHGPGRESRGGKRFLVLASMAECIQGVATLHASSAAVCDASRGRRCACSLAVLPSCGASAALQSANSAKLVTGTLISVKLRLGGHSESSEDFEETSNRSYSRAALSGA